MISYCLCDTGLYTRLVWQGVCTAGCLAFLLPAVEGWAGPTGAKGESSRAVAPCPSAAPGLGHTQAQEVFIQLHVKLLRGARPSRYYSLDLISNLAGEDRMAKACLRSVWSAVEM